jgi:hypothetical protein
MMRTYEHNKERWKYHHTHSSIELETCTTQDQHNDKKLENSKQQEEERIAQLQEKMVQEGEDEPYLKLLRSYNIAMPLQRILTKAMMVEFFQKEKKTKDVVIESKLHAEQYKNKFLHYVHKNNLLL